MAKVEAFLCWGTATHTTLQSYLKRKQWRCYIISSFDKKVFFHILLNAHFRHLNIVGLYTSTWVFAKIVNGNWKPKAKKSQRQNVQTQWNIHSYLIWFISRYKPFMQKFSSSLVDESVCYFMYATLLVVSIQGHSICKAIWIYCIKMLLWHLDNFLGVILILNSVDRMIYVD